MTKSVLRERGFPGMSTLNFEEIVKEVETQCPTVFKLLSQMIQLSHNSDKKTAPLALIYGIIMFRRCKELSRVQRVNTVSMMAVQVKRCVDYRIELLIIKLKYSGVFTCINNEGLENFTHQLYIAIISVTFGYFAIQYFFWEGFYTTSLSLLLLTVLLILCPAKDHFNQVFSI